MTPAQEAALQDLARLSQELGLYDDPPMTLDQRCAEALARIRRFINLSAAQHKFMLRGKRPIVKESLTDRGRK